MSRRDDDDDDEMDALDDLLDALDPENDEDEDIQRHIRLYALGLIGPGLPNRAPPTAHQTGPCDRAASTLLCGYDVTDQGDRARLPVDQRDPPCRRVATHVVRYWMDDFSDLFVCPLHLLAMLKRHPNDRIEPERLKQAQVSVRETDRELRR